MSGYIDMDKFLNELEELQKPHNIGFGEESTLVSINLKALINFIKELPTADVVSRERYERVMDNLKALLEDVQDE